MKLDATPAHVERAVAVDNGQVLVVVEGAEAAADVEMNSLRVAGHRLRLGSPGTTLARMQVFTSTRSPSMARYTTTIRSTWTAAEAFDYMADARNFADWDPGVTSSRLVVGDVPAEGAAYDVTVTGTTLRYVTNEYDAPRRAVLEAKSFFLRSHDVIEVSELGDGCEVTYDATLELNGLLGLGDPLLGLVFDRIGDRAAAGMATALDGEVFEAVDA